MNTDFDRAFLRVFGHEQGWVDHPNDRGGETNFGITQGTLSRAFRDGLVEHNDPKKLTPNEAKLIYLQYYWRPLAKHGLGFAITFQLFDASVNHGQANAVRFLQRASGAIPDGVLGPRTVEAVTAIAELDQILSIIVEFLAERGEFYTNLGTWNSFGKGWTRRLAQQMRYAAEDAT